jgi:hypothetical protein
MVNIVSLAVGIVAALATAVAAQDSSSPATPSQTSSASTPSGSSSAKYNLSNQGGNVLSGEINGTLFPHLFTFFLQKYHSICR